MFPPVTLGNNVQHYRLTSLTPGRLYKIVVSTFSGPNQRPQFIEGRTGESGQGQTPKVIYTSILGQLALTFNYISCVCKCPDCPSVFAAVPSAVGNLHLVPQPGTTDSTGGLQVSWTAGDGDMDMYTVSLSTTVSPNKPKFTT